MIVCSKSNMEDNPPAQNWVLPFPPKTASLYGGLIRTAPNTVLKTVGTRDGMGIDTSARRQ